MFKTRADIDFGEAEGGGEEDGGGRMGRWRGFIRGVDGSKMCYLHAKFRRPLNVEENL